MIVLQCDDGYEHWLALFLASYTAQPHAFPVVVSIFNGTAEMKVRYESMSPLIRIELDQTNRYDLPLDTYSRRECMTSRKVVVLNDIAQRFQPDWILMLDVDMLCRTDITSWVNQMCDENVELAMVKNNVDEDDIHRYFSASLIFISRSAFGFAAVWQSMIMSSESFFNFRPYEFFWDQVCLYLTMQRVQKDYDVRFLDRALFIDESFSNDAYFWTWSSPIEHTKDNVFEFFNEYKLGKPMTLDRAKYYMQLFFNAGHHRESFSFANIVVEISPEDVSAIYVLAVVYATLLNNRPLAKQMFEALIKVNYRVADCESYLNQIR
ncbi:MAG: hypothetical protein ACON35_07395 [Candidatus Marinamargulisbacteria bacterium]